MLPRLELEIKTALLAGEKHKAYLLKMLKNELTLAHKEAGAEGLDEAGELTVLRKQIKQRNDAFAAYKTAGAAESAEKEQTEAEMLQEYLPEQLTQDELQAVVQKVASSNSIALEKATMGRLIGLVAEEVGSKSSKTEIAAVINSLIGS